MSLSAYWKEPNEKKTTETKNHRSVILTLIMDKQSDKEYDHGDLGGNVKQINLK